MKIRTVGINVRVTPDEKRKILRNSRQCGLNLSEYLRKLALGYQPRPLQPHEFDEFSYVLEKIYTDFHRSFDEETLHKFLLILQAIQEKFILPRRIGNGNDKNLAD